MSQALAGAPGDDVPMPGPDPRQFKMIAAKDLRIEPRVQRDLNEEASARIHNEFDWHRFEALTVVARKTATGTTTYYITEGQTRAAAGMAFGPAFTMPCMVISENLTPAAQAQLGLDISTGRIQHSAFAQWQARLRAKHPHEVLATAALTERGLRLGRSSSTTTISATATVRRIVHGGHYEPAYGAQILGYVLDVVMLAWPTYDHESNIKRWDRTILLAVHDVLAANTDQAVNLQRLGNAMRQRPAQQFLAAGRDDRHQSPQAVVAQMIREEYNRNLRKGKLS